MLPFFDMAHAMATRRTIRPVRSLLRVSPWLVAASLLFLLARAIAVELDSWLLGIVGAGVVAVVVASSFGSVQHPPAAGRG